MPCPEPGSMVTMLGLIGTRLSERDCIAEVCVYLCLYVCLFGMSAFKYFTILHVMSTLTCTSAKPKP